MTLNSMLAVIFHYFTEFTTFGIQLCQLIQDRSILSVTEMYREEVESSFRTTWFTDII